MSAKIQKVVLNIDGEEIKLTLKQAKELQKLLDETFGGEKITFANPYPVVIERPIRVVRPYWQVDYHPSWSDTITFTCSNPGESGEVPALVG